MDSLENRQPMEIVGCFDRKKKALEEHFNTGEHDLLL